MKFLLLLLVAAQAFAAASTTILPSDPHIQIIGRADRTDPANVRIAYPGVTLRFRFTGDLAVVQLNSDHDAPTSLLSLRAVGSRAPILQFHENGT